MLHAKKLFTVTVFHLIKTVYTEGVFKNLNGLGDDRHRLHMPPLPPVFSVFSGFLH